MENNIERTNLSTKESISLLEGILYIEIDGKTVYKKNEEIEKLSKEEVASELNKLGIVGWEENGELIYLNSEI